MRWLRIIVIGVLALLPLYLAAEEKEKCGPYDGVDLADNPVLLEKILSVHKEWLADSERREDDPRRANLCRAYLGGADLVGADLSEAYLVYTNLREADLSGANLSEAFMYHVDLLRANLLGANLYEASLREANLREADLSGANLIGADLVRAELLLTNLSGAILIAANLSGAKLWATDLTDARVATAIVHYAHYEPSSVPSKGYLGGIIGLSEVLFDSGQQGGLVQLQAALKEVGLRELEREATYAIEHGKTSYAPWFEKWLKIIFFEWTSGYGLDYGRPFIILLSLLFPFAGVYYFPIAGRGASRLYLVWSDERIEDDAPVGKPERRVEPLVIDPQNNHLRIIGFALYFSLLSAFHIGWRDLNVGNWITRIQPHEYTLRAKGWVRTVSGIQSLISIYLLALWVLVYFGRPFG